MLRGERIEGEVRRVVARHLGVARELLEPAVSLRDDLGTDDATIHELLRAVERRLGVQLAKDALDAVRSYGELVDATVRAMRETRTRQARAAAAPPAVQVRITAPGRPRVDRSGPLTGYLVESIAEDARRSGPGAEVSVAVQGHPSDDDLAWVQERFAALARWGATLRVVRAADRPLLRTSG